MALKVNKTEIPPMISYFILLLGTYQILKFTNKLAFTIFYPTLKRIFNLFFKKWHHLLNLKEFENNNEKYVVIYGATTHMG